MFHSPDTDFKLFCSFLKMPITQPFIEILATKACVAVRSSPSTLSLQISPPETPSSSFSGSYLPPMYSFIRELVVGSRVQPATLFGTMVYLERIRWRLPDSFFSAPDAAYRALLSCLILSGKYLNDAAPKNKHWSTYCKIYSVSELNSMEQFFLSAMNFDLNVSCQELLVEYRAFSHLPHSAVPLPLISPLASNFPITPKSAVFPPAMKTPLNCRFYAGDPSPSGHSRSPSAYNAPVLLSHAVPYPSPLHSGAWAKPPSHFPLSKPARISELSNSSSGLYRRRTTRRQTRVSPSQLSYSVTSSCCNQTLSTTVAVPPSLSLAVRLSCENREAPLSAPLPGLLGSSRPFPTYTLRSNVPEVTIPSPLRLPPPISAGLNGFDPSLKLPPLMYPNPESSGYRAPPFLP